MNVVFSVLAERDLEDILDDLSSDYPETAHELNIQLTRRLGQLSRLPQMGRPRDDVDPGLRGLLVRPYVLFYRVKSEDIIIVRMLHGKRDLRHVTTYET